jgi:hypothetical protein
LLGGRLVDALGSLTCLTAFFARYKKMQANCVLLAISGPFIEFLVPHATLGPFWNARFFLDLQ